MQLWTEGVAGIPSICLLKRNVAHLLGDNAGCARLSIRKLFGIERVFDGDESISVENSRCSFNFSGIENFDIKHNGQILLSFHLANPSIRKWDYI